MAQEKKKFYDVEIPLLKREVEVYGHEGKFNGKSIKVDLTSSLKGRSLEVKFMIKENKGVLTTYPVEAYLQGFYIRRMMRKGTDYVEDSFLVQCKDHRLRIKPFLITRKKVSREILNVLRKKIKEEIIKLIKDKDFEAIVIDVMNNKIQKEIYPSLKKIYPLGLCEIRYIGINDLKEHEK